MSTAVADVAVPLMGSIYDCAIDPGRWPTALEKICQALGCKTAQIGLIDLAAGRMVLQVSFGISDYWLARQHEYMPELFEWLRRPEVVALPEDEPLVASRDLGSAVVATSRYVTEWSKPQGVTDGMQVNFLRTATRDGGFGVGRDDRLGPFVQHEWEIVRMLAPHIRRAVQISDVLQIKAIEVHAASSALDQLSSAVVVVDAQERLIFANARARAMLDSRDPISLAHSRLTSPDRETAERLSLAIHSAAVETKKAPSYFGIRLASADGAPCLAYAMPILGKFARESFVAPAAVALFITRAESGALRTDALGAAFDLTSMELKLLSALAEGRSVIDAAKFLGISEATARTHVQNVYRKTGVVRQSELVALVHRLLPPI